MRNCTDYDKTIELINSIKPSEISPFFYDGIDSNNIVQSTFEFYCQNSSYLTELMIPDKKETIVFFFSMRIINAFASCWGSYNVIGISSETVRFPLVEFNSRNENLNTLSICDAFQDCGKNIDDVFQLMYQGWFHFIFYHEFAHIIQTNNTKFKINEELRTNYNVNNHIKEYDADKFASIFAGQHMFQYIENIYLTKSNFMMEESYILISPVVASIFVLISKLSGGSKPLYLKNNSHPHPVIRIIGVISTMLVVLQNSFEKKYNLKFKIKEAIENILDAVDEMLVPLNNDHLKIKSNFVNLDDNAKSYIELLECNVTNIPTSAFNEYNRIVRILNSSSQ